jgi:hypothetical protein
VLTVSPNKQKRGIFEPTTPATHVPECIPIRNLNGIPGKCDILNCPQWCKRFKATVAISPACRSPFCCGSPETTYFFILENRKAS